MIKKNKHFLVEVAREAVRSFLIDPQVAFSLKESVPEAYRKWHNGVFVTVYDRAGELRGRIGTYEPTQENIVLEIMANAISAATKDPRFKPLQIKEIDSAVFIIDVLSEMKEVESLEDLDPMKYGLFIKKNDKQGIVLPGTSGIKTVKEQLSYLLEQSGIAEYYGAEMLFFTVERLEE